MNLQDLKYFHELVTQKSFTRTAERFNVSQPTITAAIKRLEAQFGSHLLIRDQSHKKIIITKAGMQLEQHAQAVIKEMAVAETELKQNAEEDILFGLPPIIGDHFFPPFAGKLLKEDILNHLNVLEFGSNELLKMLLAGKINLALLGLVNIHRSTDVKLNVLAKYPFKVIVSKDHPWAKKKGVYFNELAGHNFINLTEDFVQNRAIRYLQEQNKVTLKTIYRSPDVAIIKSLVAQNLGISVLTSLAIDNTRDLVALPLLDDNTPNFNVVIATRNNYLLSKKEEQLWNILALS